MKTRSMISTLKRALYGFAAFSLLVGCGGGSGGGASTSPYITVTKVTPADNATAVDARVESITASFSADLDVSSFITQGKALGKLLSGKGIKLQDSKSGAVVDPNGLSLGELVSGKYTVLVKINGADTLAVLESYTFVKDTTGAYGLSIKLLNQNQTLEFTSTELLDSGIVNSNLVKVQNTKSGTLAYGQIVVKDKTLTFYPINFLDWSSDYTVTISAAVKDASGRPLEADFIWKFQTEKLPTPAIENVSPLGIDANPIKKIYAKPNFNLNVASLSASSVVLNKLVRTSSDQPATKTQLDVGLSYDKATAQIVISPTADLEYLQEYEVTVKAAGINGSFGNVDNQRLGQDYVWTFTTAQPQVISTSPVAGDDTNPSVEREASIFVETNFRPNPATIGSGIFLTETLGQIAVPVTATVTEGVVKLVPKTLLKYGTQYTLTVTPALKSVNNAAISLAANYTMNFTTVKRKIISQSPYSGETSVASNKVVKIQFNFDLNEAPLPTISVLKKVE